jgi:hypothetical protein
MSRDHRAGYSPASESSKREQLQDRVKQAVLELQRHMGDPDAFVMPVGEPNEKKFFAFGTVDSIAALLGIKAETPRDKGLFDDDQSSIH